MAAIPETVQVEPAFPHEYVRFGCDLIDARRGVFWLDDYALAGDAPRGWLAVLDDAAEPLPESPWARAPRSCSFAGFGFRTRPA